MKQTSKPDGHASRGFTRLGFTLLMTAQAAGMLYLLFLMSGT